MTMASRVAPLLAHLDPREATVRLPEVTVRLPAPPPAGGMFSLLAGLCILLLVVVIARRLLRGKRGSTLFFSASVSVGNALMDFAGMLQPNHANVESIQKAESARENEAHTVGVGDGRDPAAGYSGSFGMKLHASNSARQGSKRTSVPRVKKNHPI